jgi:hypothetical protein
MENLLLTKVIENRGGNYCHVVEVGTVYELECIAEAICQENEDEFSIEIITDFLESLTVYYLPEEDSEEDSEEEEKIYSFSFADYINSNLI